MTIYDDIAELLAICEMNGLDFRMDGRSDYYPGRTIRVRLWKANR